jgi:uncharacterized protein YbcC (UPF0753/DUF2309 family)
LVAIDRIDVLEQLRHAIDHAAHLLPAQGPINVFIHHNTLHALEDLPFTEAVKRGATVFGCQPYLTRSRYREELRRGRIRFADLEAILRENLGMWAEEKVLSFCTRLELRLVMLQYPVPFGPTEELLWFVAERDALRRIRMDVSAAVRGRLVAETRRWVMRDLRGGHEAGRPSPSLPAGEKGKKADLSRLLERFGASRIEEWGEDDWEAFTLQALWRVCCDGVAGVPDLTLPPLLPVRHRDLLLQVARVDADLLVHDVLIRFCGTFLDQGLAHWPLPGRDEGFYRAFCALYRPPFGPPDRWLRGLASELTRLEDAQVSPLESIWESLDALGVGEAELDDFLSATLLALRGWAGMVRFLQERGDRAVRPLPEGSLVEFLAIRLLLDRLALAHVAGEILGFAGPLRELRLELWKRLGPRQLPSPEQRAFVVFQLAQVLGWSPPELHRLSVAEWATLLEEIETFPAIERRRILHLAYEQRLYSQTLDALALHNRRPPPALPTPGVGEGTVGPAPRFQAIFCIDEREESMRRHLEEAAPDAITFGIAGFYFVPMYYRGTADTHFVPLCPAVVRPQHWVVEQVVESAEEGHQRHGRSRRALALVSRAFHVASRSFVLGALLSAVGGVLASIPLIARTLVPRLTARLRLSAGRLVEAPILTRLRLERDEPTPGPENARVGFSLEERTDIAERVLRDTGLTIGFSRFVVIFGHGSTSLNNPHESAHDCGACGGSRGGPNARAIAHILNDLRVREGLKARGLIIPPETVFVGGMHNTSSEAITFYDLDRLPESHREEFEQIRALMEEAADRDAHERCRRFESAPLTLSFEAARQHVEGRAEDLAQVRPEWGHATNAICVVGRRQRTRGLFLDRRAFLNSYDPTQDDADATILTRILHAAVPVCAGISLEYYFSYVDNQGYGCGTKLPHNIAALLGVMDGAASDLRTGLPWQMVEIHEPVRILFVIETRPETMLRVMDCNAGIGRLFRNEWVRLAVLSPESAEVQIFRGGAFHGYEAQAMHLPKAASSTGWYRGWRDHLEFAEIEVAPAANPDY